MADLNKLTIGDLIRIPPVQTVIRLEQARTDAKQIAESFVLTADIADHLHVLADSLSRPHGAGCFVQGDFGSGKSHLLAALTALLDRSQGFEKLAAGHEGLSKFVASGKRLLPVDISLVAFRAATPLERIITGGIEQTLRARGSNVTLSPLRAFIEHLRTALDSPGMARSFAQSAGIDETALESWLEENPREAYAAGLRFLSQKGLPQPEELITDRQEVLGTAMRAAREAGFDGIVLLLDELSEFFRSKPDPAALNEDARMLQLLGELAQREPIWVIAAVQESIERTGDIAQATFRKIKDRFPLRFHLSTVHIRDLIHRRLVVRRDGADERILDIHERFRTHFRGFTVPSEQFLAVYPVHPATLSLLEGLGDLFSQHRGIVDFVYARVGGDSSRGIPGILDRPCTELLAPDSLYEHFSQRLMELSSFNAYPRHVIPHLDKTIDECLEEPDDRHMARRLVRMLVLYAIHPTVQPPTARRLAELAACTITGQDPDLNAQFIAEAILEPIAAQSRFLTRRDTRSGDPLDATFHLGIEEDFGKALRARIDERMRGMRPDDSRIVLEPLAALDAPGSWPGRVLWDGVQMPANWRGSSRRAYVVFVGDGTQEQAAQRIRGLLERAAIDAALAIVYGATPFECENTAVWRITPPSGPAAAPLIEHRATETVLAELRPTNPADTPLAQPAREALNRLQPMVRQALLQLFYEGRFDDDTLNTRLEPAARQVRHFDRLVELAAASVCESRYPRFADIAPRGPISVMVYQRMMEECIVPGTISLRQAREKGITEALDSAARNLGLLEVRGGSYVLAPNPGDHPFLGYLFGLIRPGRTTELDEVLFAVRTGPYGVPNDMAAFVLCALAHSGLVTLSSGGRAVPVELLRTVSLERVDGVAPGELITAADRETIINECPFLAPDDGWASFGLRQQREAWQKLVKLKGSLPSMLERLRNQFEEAATYSALRSFDLELLRDTAGRLLAVFDEVKTSYQAREGLERFLAAWRTSRITADDLELLKRVQRFFSRAAQQFVFINHYARHRSVDAAAAADPEIARLRREVVTLLDNPLEGVVPDDGEGLGEAFRALRDAYAPRYIETHSAFYEAMKRPPMPRQARRGLALLQRLRTLSMLDEPRELQALVAQLEEPEPKACGRNLVEELQRAPVCDCGVVFGDIPPESSRPDPGALVERALGDYLILLRSPEVLEALAARSFAMRDIDAPMATRLQKLRAALTNAGTESVTALADLLDDQTLEECRGALAQTTPMCARSLDDLAARLQGRRLTRQHIIDAVDAWIGDQPRECIVAIEQGNTGGTVSAETPVGWWPVLHRTGAFEGLPPAVAESDQVRRMAQACERSFPVSSLAPMLERLPAGELAAFITREPVHTRAIEAAWRILASRVLKNLPNMPSLPHASAHLDASRRREITSRLQLLERLRGALNEPMPRCLTARIELSRLGADPWTTDDIAKTATGAVTRLSESASDWLTTLPSCEPVDFAGRPCVLLYDAVPIDVWLEALRRRPIDGAQVAWQRLDGEAHTVSALCAMLDVGPSEEPLDVCAVKGIEYITLSGNEEAPLAEMLPPLDGGPPVLVRIAIFDREAHSGGLRLEALLERFGALLERHLQCLRPACAAAGRTLILTSDHGVSLARGGLTHGTGGVYERVAPRILVPTARS